MKHSVRCEFSKRIPKTCKCMCKGYLHGIAYNLIEEHDMDQFEIME